MSTDSVSGEEELGGYQNEELGGYQNEELVLEGAEAEIIAELRESLGAIPEVVAFYGESPAHAYDTYSKFSPSAESTESELAIEPSEARPTIEGYDPPPAGLVQGEEQEAEAVEVESEEFESKPSGYDPPPVLTETEASEMKPSGYDPPPALTEP